MDVVALGELLIDFTENGISSQGNPLFEANPGGAPCNVLAMLTKLGHKTAFIGKVGNDFFGKQLEQTIMEVGIDASGLQKDDDVHTTLALVHTYPDGDRDFSFYRNPGADMMLKEEGAQAAIVRGSCTTKFDPRASRATNIAVAASRINGVVIQPGEEFSFNRTILPRTAANGYVEAPIYVSGKHSTGTGGGICQVSSTMYSAMLNGGIPATERHPHSLPVPYLPEGRDATIAGNYYDLRFVNIYNTPLQISAVADLRTGTVSVTLIQQ